ncbi:hypothetical protein BGZ88_004655, partial [Linnemannia elongata]
MWEFFFGPRHVDANFDSQHSAKGRSWTMHMNTQILDNAEFLSTLDTLLSTQEEPQMSETRQQHWDK